MLRFAIPSLLVLIASSSLPLPESNAGVTSNAGGEVDEIIIYRTMEGESLKGLADKWFVNPANWQRAQAMNRIGDPEKLPANYPLKLRASWLKSTPMAAEVIAFRGQASADLAGETNPVVIGMKLAEGDRVQTGTNGFVTLRLPDGSIVSLPSNSAVRMERLRTVALTGALDRRFALEKGRTEAQVEPLIVPGSRFLINTPVSVAAVRGTRYRVSYVPAEMKALTEVLEGRVAVGKAADAAGGTLLTPGHGVVATARSVSGALALLPAPLFDGMAGVQSGAFVQIRVKPVQGAVRYSIEITRDRDGMQKVALMESDTPEGRVPDIGNGQYYAHVSAVGREGLIGLPGRYGFERRVPVSGKDKPKPKKAQQQAEKKPPRVQPYDPNFAADNGMPLAGLLFADGEQMLESERAAAGEGASMQEEGSADDSTGSDLLEAMWEATGYRFGTAAAAGYMASGGNGVDDGGTDGGTDGTDGGTGGGGGVIIVTPPNSGGGDGTAPSTDTHTVPYTPPLPPATGTMVPEPAGWVMMIAGFGLVGLVLRRRARVKSPAA